MQILENESVAIIMLMNNKRCCDCVLWKIGSVSLTDSVSCFAVNLTDVSTLTASTIFGSYVVVIIFVLQLRLCGVKLS